MKRYDDDVRFVSEMLFQLEYYCRYLKASTDFECVLENPYYKFLLTWGQNQYFNCLDQPYAGMCILIYWYIYCVCLDNLFIVAFELDTISCTKYEKH
jgi:hypothetical protein